MRLKEELIHQLASIATQVQCLNQLVLVNLVRFLIVVRGRMAVKENHLSINQKETDNKTSSKIVGLLLMTKLKPLNQQETISTLTQFLWRS